MVCSQCGAVVKEGRFCNYCGARLPDDTNRVEIKVERRFENAAELKRLELEEQEILHRREEEKQKKMIRRRAMLLTFIISALFLLVVLLFRIKDTVVLTFALCAGLLAGLTLMMILYAMVSGKW